MDKKLRDRSQYYPDLKHISPSLLLHSSDSSVEFHSQIGVGYQLANLGSLDEFYDRLAKYDIDDKPLRNRSVAQRAINHFLDLIGPCKFLSPEQAYELMDKSASIGFGAQQEKVNHRNDPKMFEYLMDYVYASLDRTHHVVVSASQKDEVRVSTKTPRLFTAFPPEHTFLAQMVLGDFLRQWLKHSFCKDRSVSAVGDSIQQGAARVYLDELLKRPYLYCTDTSAQDASVTSEFLNMFYDSIKLKYDLNEQEEQLFECVRFNSIYKLMNVNGDLYLVSRGLGSGDFLTIIINIVWRYYMILENYKHDIDKYTEENTTIICGDDLVMSSDHPDLDLSSKYAQIEWAGRPVSVKELDFCSLRFYPFIHHDASKVRAVLYNRKKKVHQFSPDFELQRLGGLLRCCSTRDVYDEILLMMVKMVKSHPNLNYSFKCLFATYEEIYYSYNTNIRFD